MMLHHYFHFRHNTYFRHIDFPMEQLRRLGVYSSMINNLSSILIFCLYHYSTYDNIAILSVYISLLLVHIQCLASTIYATKYKKNKKSNKKNILCFVQSTRYIFSTVTIQLLCGRSTCIRYTTTSICNLFVLMCWRHLTVFLRFWSYTFL